MQIFEEYIRGEHVNVEQRILLEKKRKKSKNKNRNIKSQATTLLY